jgi:hypothetical protein
MRKEEGVSENSEFGMRNMENGGQRWKVEDGLERLEYQIYR